MQFDLLSRRLGLSSRRLMLCQPAAKLRPAGGFISINPITSRFRPSNHYERLAHSWRRKKAEKYKHEHNVNRFNKIKKTEP
jgi:hypothetical protein